MNEIIDKLKKEFFITPNVSENINGSVNLQIASDWRSRTDEVNKVNIYISGVDPYTGEQLDQDRYSYSFDSVHTLYKPGVVKLNGDYSIHFDAYFEDGHIEKDFKEPEKIRIVNKNCKREITYSYVSAPNDWTCIEFNANCWKLCNGKLWIKFDDQLQLLPDFHSNEMRCYIPVSYKELKNKGIKFFLMDENLPEPIEKKKD